MAYELEINPTINPRIGSWIAYNQNQTPPKANQLIVSINDPINRPIIGPKYQPIIIPGNHAKEMVTPEPILIFNKFNKILSPSKAASKQIPVIDLKTFIGQKGNKNLTTIFEFIAP